MFLARLASTRVKGEGNIYHGNCPNQVPSFSLPHIINAMCNITSKSQELNFEISEISEFCVRTAAVNYAWENKIDGKDSLRLGLIRIRVN